MSRYTPLEKSQRSLEFEVRVLEIIVSLTGETFRFTRYLPSTEIMLIKELAQKRLKVALRYKSKNKKRLERDNKAIFESCLKKKRKESS